MNVKTLLVGLTSEAKDIEHLLPKPCIYIEVEGNVNNLLKIIDVIQNPSIIVILFNPERTLDIYRLCYLTLRETYPSSCIQVYCYQREGDIDNTRKWIERNRKGLERDFCGATVNPMDINTEIYTPKTKELIKNCLIRSYRHVKLIHYKTAMYLACCNASPGGYVKLSKHGSIFLLHFGLEFDNIIKSGSKGYIQSLYGGEAISVDWMGYADLRHKSKSNEWMISNTNKECSLLSQGLTVTISYNGKYLVPHNDEGYLTLTDNLNEDIEWILEMSKYFC